MNNDLWQRIDEHVRVRHLDTAIAELEAGLAACRSPRFKGLITADFANSPATIADHVSGFITRCEALFPVRAVDLEMNGFDINVDLWYFDSFAYRHCPDTADPLEWLADWDSPDFPAVPLTGMEDVQREYDWYSNNDGCQDSNARTAADFATLLVMCKFARLIGRAVETRAIRKSVPILASAHDFDVIPTFLS